MINYFYDCYQILNKVYSDKTFVKQAITQIPIEEKNRSATIKTVYGVLDKDIELSYYLTKLADKSPKLAIRTILKISMYCIKFLQKKSYAVVQNAVELTKKLGKGGASGFVNAFLRKFTNNNIELPKNTIQNLSIKYSFPEFAVCELVDYFGKDYTEQILNSHTTENTLFFPNGNGEEYLKNLGVNYQNTPFENTFSVLNFVRNGDYDKGVYTYQSLGSTAICDVVEGCKNLLDCCSAPGGKAVKLSYKCERVTAWDIHEHRVQLINDYVARMGINNVTTNVCDSKVYNSQYNEYFDGVLCDAPCSGLGVVNDNPDIKLNRSLNDVKELNIEQLSILSNVSKYVKVGGYLYYSTCSILPCENIQIVNKFLSNNDNFEIEKIDSKLPHIDIQGTNAFLPNISNGVGFYVAKLKRIK